MHASILEKRDDAAKYNSLPHWEDKLHFFHDIKY